MAIWHLLTLTLALAAGRGPDPEPINPCDSAVIHNTRAALEAVRHAAVLHGTSTPCTSAYEGTIEIEAHLAKPGMVMTRPVRIELDWDGNARFALREVTGEGKSATIETMLVVDGRVGSQPSSHAPFKELAGTDAASSAASIRQWLPAPIVRSAITAAASCRLAPEIEYQGEPLRPVSFADGSGSTCSLLLDRSGRVARIETLASDPRLGDVCNWTQFSDWDSHGEVTAPARVERFLVAGSVTVRYRLALRTLAFDPVSDDQFALPESNKADLPDWRATIAKVPSSATTLAPLAPKVWSVELLAADARSLVIEGDADLVVLEAPSGDGACTDLLNTLEQHFPTKPVSKVAFGHHHPSPSGGLRAFAAAGATIIAPRALESYVRQLLTRPTTLGPPAIAAPPDAKLELFDNERTIQAGQKSVRLIDIGRASAHADTYIVFYIPEDGILFEGDLSYFPMQGAIRVGPRLQGLVNSMAQRGITPARLIQTWPVRGALLEVPWSTVASLVQAEHERTQGPSDKSQSGK